MSLLPRQQPIDFDAYDTPASSIGNPSTGNPSGTKRGRDGKEKESFKCPHPGCGQAYSRMEYMKRHQRKHQDVRPFACRDCDKSFARSDVLLRHRRRCHPTPPPELRSSRSPGPAPRVYPGVPVSSSRNDARAFSPVRNRKAFRSNHIDTNGHTRTRTGSDEDEEDAFAFQALGAASGIGQMMGGGHEEDPGVYDIGGEYYALGESSTYTPHLLPMFQNPVPTANPNQPVQGTSIPYPSSTGTAPNRPQNQNRDDPNHLEDASVLLSMAYPGGVPGDGSARQNRGSLGGEWDGQTSINMMMPEKNDNGDLALGEQVGNFLNSMDWLGSGKQSNTSIMGNGSGNGTGNQGWMSAGPTLTDAIDPSLTGLDASQRDPNDGLHATSYSKPASPFPLSSLFSPSLFNLPSLPTLSNQTTTSEETSPDEPIFDPNSPTVMNILDQLAMYEVPQTKINTNPERPLIRIGNQAVYDRQGMSILNPESRFYVSPARFTGCYEIPHWRMPPIRALSLMAAKTYHTVLAHFSFIHQPTFKLHDTAACLAFAICTVGGIKSSSVKKQGYDDFLPRKTKIQGGNKMDGPVMPQSSWESLYESNYVGDQARSRSGTGGMSSGSSPSEVEKELEEEKRMVEEWDTAGLVRNDKTNMLVKSFSQAKGVLMTEYNVGLLQALILYHAPYFLSENEQERAMANMFLGTIVNITRQIGFLAADLEHFEPVIHLPPEPSTPNDLNLAWRRWIQLETRRRTAYLVYHLDTVSSLEANISCILTSCEYSNLPLPAPDTLWLAPTAERWAAAASTYRPLTMDEAMRRLFFLPSYGAFDTLHEKASTKHYCLLNDHAYGPFARVAMVLTLVRGIMDIGEGKRDRGDWRDLTDLWVGCSWLKPGKKMLDGDGKEIGEVTREGLRARFALALDVWRTGWDFDQLCLSGAGAGSRASASPDSNVGSSSGNKTLMYCEEALPFYWLAQALLSILNSAPPHELGFNAFKGLKYGEMLKSARTFTRLGEGAGAASAMGIDNCPTVISSKSTNSAGTGTGFGETPIGVGNTNPMVYTSNNDVHVIPGQQEVEDDLFMGLDGLGGMGIIDGLDFGLISTNNLGMGAGMAKQTPGTEQGWAPYI